MFSGQGEKVGCFYGKKNGRKESHKWREIKGSNFTTLKWQTHTFLL
jgi:putative heme degradation protein